LLTNVKFRPPLTAYNLRRLPLTAYNLINLAGDVDTSKV